MWNSHSKMSPPPSPPMTPPLSPNHLLRPHPPRRQEVDIMSQSDKQRLTARAKRSKYFRRLVKIRQMDFEYALWQMIYLFISPQKVYRNFQFRKQTKDQWARDDPAFLVLLSGALVISSLGFCFVLGLHFLAFIKFLLWVIFVDCIGVGIVVATIFWFVTNKYMLMTGVGGSRASQDVEWGYAFDVHLNAFFPLLMILHLFQLIFYAIIYINNYFSCFLGNTLWLVALGYYVYITFLGYSALSFLKNTRIFLFPLSLLVILYILSVCLHWNVSRVIFEFYKHRVF